jgi:hypothetical protein
VVKDAELSEDHESGKYERNQRIPDGWDSIEPVTGTLFKDSVNKMTRA